jgi:hypothetical protein
MQLLRISKTDQEFHLATHKVIIKAADVAALAADAAVLPIIPASGTFPAGTVARFAGMKLVTAFDSSDAAINSLTIQIGDGGTANRLLTATELHVDGTEVLYKVEGAVTQPYAYLVADAIDATLTAAGGGSPTLAETTLGEVHLYLYLHTPGDDLAGVKGPLA